MKINEIFDRILLRSGQFILRKAKIEMDVDNFRILVEDAASEFSGFVPYTKEYNLDMNSSRSYTFPSDFDPDLKRSPDWLAEVTPINSFGSIASVFNANNLSPGSNAQAGGGSGSPLVEPREAPWHYNKHTKLLTVPYSSFYKIVGVYEHLVTKVEGTENEWEIKTIGIADQPFFRILQGMFLQGIGRSRRAFTLGDLPILMDADTLVSEGEAILEKAMQEVLDDQKFYLAYD